MSLSAVPHPQWLPQVQQKSLWFSAKGISCHGYRLLVVAALLWCQMAKSVKSRERVTHSVKLLRFSGVSVIFNVVAMFSWAVHTMRSSHMSSITTNRYFSSDAASYTNTAHTKSIVRDCNPVTGFTIKERISGNTKTTL